MNGLHLASVADAVHGWRMHGAQLPHIWKSGLGDGKRSLRTMPCSVAVLRASMSAALSKYDNSTRAGR